MDKDPIFTIQLRKARINMNKNLPTTNYAGYYRGEIRSVVLAPGSKADCWFKLAAKMAVKVKHARENPLFEVKRVSIEPIQGLDNEE